MGKCDLVDRHTSDPARKQPFLVLNLLKWFTSASKQSSRHREHIWCAFITLWDKKTSLRSQMSGRKNLYPSLSPAAWKFRAGWEYSVRKPGHVWTEVLSEAPSQGGCHLGRSRPFRISTGVCRSGWGLRSNNSGLLLCLLLFPVAQKCQNCNTSTLCFSWNWLQSDFTCLRFLFLLCGVLICCTYVLGKTQ